MSEGDGRVTMALLAQKLDQYCLLQKEQNDLLKKHIEDSEKRMRDLEIRQAEQGKDLAQLDDTVERLQTRDIAGTVAGVVSAVIAGLIALFKP